MRMQMNVSFKGETHNASTQECPYVLDPYFDRVSDRLLTNIITSVINGVLSPFAFVGNLFTIFVLWKNPALHSPAYVLLGSLAISDLLVGLAVQPSFVIYKVGELVNKHVPCFTMVFYYSCATLGSGVSFLTLTAITCERYLALFLHLRYADLVTYKVVFAVCLGAWFINVVTILLWLMGFHHVHVGLMFAVISACLLTTAYAYIRIFCLARRHNNEIQVEQRRFSRASGAHRFAQQMKVTVTTICIVSSYYFCFLPFFTVNIFEYFHGFDANLRNIYSIVETVAYLASSLNPIIYCWRNTLFRETMLHSIQKAKSEIFCVRIDNENHGAGSSFPAVACSKVFPDGPLEPGAVP